MSNAPSALARTRFGLLLVSGIVFGCQGVSDPGTRESDEIDHELAAAQHDPLHKVGRRLAAVLASQSARELFHEMVENSPYRERRVQFRDFMAALPEEYKSSLRSQWVEWTSEEGLRAVLDVYLPVESHRNEWNGESTILIGVVLQDSRDVAIYESLRSPYRQSGSVPPGRPTIMVGPTELDYSNPEFSLRANKASMSGQVNNVSGSEDLYLSDFRASDLLEAWYQGAAEVFALSDAGLCVSFSVSQENHHYFFSPSPQTLLASDFFGGSLFVEFYEDDSASPCFIDAGTDDFYGSDFFPGPWNGGLQTVSSILEAGITSN